MTALSTRFTEAVDYARAAHAAQYRKGTQIPYLYHLLGVSSLVLEYGGDEDQAIAGLLHDVLEDCGSEHEDPIRSRFGAKVIEIVLDCTDGSVETKAAAEAAGSKLENWRQRKLAYLAHLRDKPDHTLLVSGCDKLHNARAILGDLEHPEVGPAVFERFTAGREGTLAYYQSLSEILGARRAPMAWAFEQTIARIHELAGAQERRGLE
jgi:(p)ppGpp synthase/HD superfamily hydrolase